MTQLGLKIGSLWQQENYDRLVRDREELAVWQAYIRGNPEKARLCAGSFLYQACDWL